MIENDLLHLTNNDAKPGRRLLVLVDHVAQHEVGIPEMKPKPMSSITGQVRHDVLAKSLETFLHRVT